MKSGQSIEYNRREIYLEKSYVKCVRETVPKSFSKKSKLSISLDYSLFLLYVKLRAIEIC